MAKYKSPGVYEEKKTKRVRPIQLVKTGVAGFIGIAQKGPIHLVQHLKSWNDFVKIFGGFVPYGYLAYAVYGFFSNGGDECYVVRVAHTGDSDETQNATKSFFPLTNRDGEEFGKITVSSEGTWANNIKVEISPARCGVTILAENLPKGSFSATVKSIQGFERGSLIKINNGTNSEYFTLTSISDNKIFWSKDKPLQYDYNVENGQVVIESVEFNIKLNLGRIYEEFDNLSGNSGHSRYFCKIVNRFSHLVSMIDEKPDLQGFLKVPSFVSGKTLAGGRDGIVGITPADFIGYNNGLENSKGLGILESIEEISLIAIPDLMNLKMSQNSYPEEDIFAVQQAMIDHCRKMKNCFVILDAPYKYSIEGIIKWRSKFDSKYAALYYPWIKILDPVNAESDKTILIPPSGHIAGIFSRSDEQIGVHKAPANEIIFGAIDVDLSINNNEQDGLNPLGINCIRYFPGRGIKVWGARTLSSSPEWRYINVRRLFSAIEKAIYEGTQWAVFEPNNEFLWKAVTRTVTAFLLELWKKGYMSGVIPEDAFYVKCDSETNPPEVQDAGQVVIEVGIAIAKPAEFIIFRITQMSEEVIVEEKEG